MQHSLKALTLAIHANTPACTENIKKKALDMEWVARHLNDNFKDEYRQARANIKKL